MDNYIKLIEELVKKQEESINTLNNINKEISKLDQYKKLKSDIETENFAEIKEIVKNSNLDNEIKLKIEEIITINKLIGDIESDILKIDIENLKQSLAINDKDILIDNLKTIIDAEKIISNSEMVDPYLETAFKSLKKTASTFLKESLTNLKEELCIFINDKYNNQKLEELLNNKKELLLSIESLKKFISIIGENGFIDILNTDEEIISFFELLKTIDNEEINPIEIASDFTKSIINNYTNLSNEEQDIREHVNENSIDVNRNLEQANNTQEENDGYEEVDIFSLLSDEEKEIYNSILEILENNDNLPLEDIEIAGLKDNFSLNKREMLYNNAYKINLNLIISDIRYNLLPNLNNNKDDIFEIFKYILNIYYSYIELTYKKGELQSTIYDLSNQLDASKKIYKYYNESSDSNKKTINFILESLEKKDFETVNILLKQFDKPKVFFEILLLRKKIERLITDIQDIIEFDSLEDINNFYKELEPLVSIYCNKNRELLEEYSKLNPEISTETLKNVENLAPTKTLLYFFDDEFDSYDNDEKKYLQQAVSKLVYSPWEKIKSNSINHILGEIWRIKKNGKRDYYKKEIYKPYRIKGTNNDRTGLIRINVCPELAKIIYDKYRIPSPLIIVLKPFLIPGEDHSNYNEKINHLIRKNEDRINYIAKLFYNPNADLNEVFDIIEKGIVDAKKIVSQEFTGGAIQI